VWPRALPTCFGKSLIFQLFVKILARRSSTSGCSAIGICPLESIIQYQILEAQSIGITVSSLSEKRISEVCENTPQLLFAKAEDVQNPEFRTQLKDKNSALHREIALIVVDESHTVETWTGKRYVIHNTKHNRWYFLCLHVYKYFACECVY